MAKRATGKAASGGAKKVQKAKSGSSESRSKSRSSRLSQNDPVDALIKLLQSPLVIDLLAVGATAALAAITEQRSGRAQGAVGTGSSKKALKAAGKAAASAVGRRLATEFDEIKAASKQAREARKPKAGAAA